MKNYILISLLSLILLSSCEKESTIEDDIYGVWVIEDDAPGRQPADTLHFYKAGDESILAFYSAGSPGPAWPDYAVTNFGWNEGKLVIKDYSGTSGEYFTIESFQWEGKDQFSLKFHELLFYISADYRVTYKKLKYPE